MTNEMTVVNLLGNNGDQIEYTCTTGTAIAKGELMEITDPRTVQKISADNKPVAGIAAWEKTTTDGKTTMSVITNAVVKCTVGATAATVGFLQAPHASDNTIGNADAADIDEGLVIGKALETGATGETILMKLMV